MKSYAYAACERVESDRFWWAEQRLGGWYTQRASVKTLPHPWQTSTSFNFKWGSTTNFVQNRQTNKPQHHICEKPYNYFVRTLPKAATKTQESLIVILSTVIFSKRRKIKSFWIEPSVSEGKRFNRPPKGHSESCALWDIIRNSQQIIHEQHSRAEFSPWCGKLSQHLGKTIFRHRIFLTYIGSGPARAESAGSRTFPTLSSNEEGFHTSVNIKLVPPKIKKRNGWSWTQSNGLWVGQLWVIFSQTPKHSLLLWANKSNNQSICGIPAWRKSIYHTLTRSRTRSTPFNQFIR